MNVKCPYFHDHTACPPGYIQWHPWAARKARTHKQIKCTGCGFYAIWVPKTRRKSRDSVSAKQGE
jgi:hypothetical protein